MQLICLFLEIQKKEDSMREFVGSFWWLWFILIVFATVGISETGKQILNSGEITSKFNKPILNDLSFTQLFHFLVMVLLIISLLIKLLNIIFPK
jgi:hypothetical protein